MNWRVWLESNLRPLPSEGNTLSTELQTRFRPQDAWPQDGMKGQILPLGG